MEVVFVKLHHSVQPDSLAEGPMRRPLRPLISMMSIAGVLAILALPGLAMAKKKPPTPPPAPDPTPMPTTQPSDSSATKQAAVTSAKQELKTATAALSAVVQKATSDFQASDAYVSASKDLTAAKRAYDAASTPALERVHSSPEYVAAMAQYKSAHDQIEALRSGGDPPQDQISPLAQQELTSGSKARSLESDALLTDDGVVHAKAQVATAQAAIAALRDQFQKTMPTTPEYTTAKQAVDEATKKLQAAQAMASAN
jgi:hypothetical protein